MLNIRAQHETLHHVKLGNNSTANDNVSTLKDLLLTVKDQQDNLFMAAERGAGKNSSDVNVILNPKVKEKAREWLINDHATIAIDYQCENSTSVNEQKVEAKEKYDKNLKEFLRPMLQQEDTLKTKGFGKKIKSYAQALGIEVPSKATKSVNNNGTKAIKRKEKEVVENEKDKEIEDSKKIKEDMKMQMGKMTAVIVEACNSAFDSNI